MLVFLVFAALVLLGWDWKKVVGCFTPRTCVGPVSMVLFQVAGFWGESVCVTVLQGRLLPVVVVQVGRMLTSCMCVGVCSSCT